MVVPPMTRKLGPDAADAAAGAAQQVADLPQDFESALAELEALVSAMENASLPLEQSLASYQRGVALSRVCQQRLAAAEQQIQVLEGELLRPLDGAAMDEESR
ncbi:Exodeoxyribonuclease 7 small subunit [Kerstersia similis]